MIPNLGGLTVTALLAAAVVVALADHHRSALRWKRLGLRAPGKAVAGVKTGAEDTAATDAGLRDPAMMLELIGAMLDAGAGLGRSLELVAAHAAPGLGRPLGPVVSALAIGADWETAWRSSHSFPAQLLALRDALGFAALTGVPSSAILYTQAARLRREHFRAAERRAAALGVQLVIPLGLCSLPAFVCLGIVPVLLAMLPNSS
ncbi:type II secretion system F family protein [uncultured Arthrobacter sp.]|uniref:type II secretion system F family protein n=1 Tax=uncultured Arthrobacter sp. TaxID=114050 RepID=UPI0032164FE2